MRGVIFKADAVESPCLGLAARPGNDERATGNILIRLAFDNASVQSSIRRSRTL